MATINYHLTSHQRDERRVWLDEKDCVRLTRTEFEAVRYMLGAVNYLAKAKDVMIGGPCLKRIPHGDARMRMTLGGLKSIIDDILGTVTVKQCMQLSNTMADMEMRMVPKMTPMTTNVVMEESIAKELIDLARVACKDCTRDGKTCLQCALYPNMEAIVPLDDYGAGTMCPYALTDWASKQKERNVG